jgi:hypothetical protein
MMWKSMRCLRLSPSRPSVAVDRAADAKPQRRQEAAQDGAGSLTTGKLNAVRAAFKAGVKPSAIARQFGILQSDVRKALAHGPRQEPDLVARHVNIRSDHEGDMSG